MADQSRKLKRSKYPGLGEEEKARKRLRINELERDRQHEKQGLFNRMDQLVPNQYKTSSHKEGSQTAILENVVHFLTELPTFISTLQQSVANNVATPFTFHSDINQNILQPTQQKDTEPNEEMLQQPSLHFSAIENPLPCQTPVPLLNQSEVQQVPQPSHGGTTLNHHPLQAMSQQSSALLPVTSQTGNVPTQQNILPWSATPLGIGAQQNKMATELQNLSPASQRFDSQSNFSMPTTSCPVKRYLRKISQDKKLKQDLKLKPSTKSGISLVQSTSMMSNHPRLNVNTLTSSANSLQPSQWPMPNFHYTMSNLSQNYDNTLATPAIPLQSSDQPMPNFHSMQSPDCSVSLNLPVPNEQEFSEFMLLDMPDHLENFIPTIPDLLNGKTDSAVDLIPQGFTEHGGERDNPDTESSGQTSRQATAGSNDYHMSTAEERLEIENSLFVLGADIGLRPEEGMENLAHRNFDSDQTPDNPIPELSDTFLEALLNWEA